MPKKSGLRYPEEFKAEAVQLARSSPEKSIRQLAYELGISDQTLRNCVKQAQIDRGEREGLSTKERQELRELRCENRILREEREILKKPQLSSRRKTGPGELLQAHRGGKSESLCSQVVPNARRIALGLLCLEATSAISPVGSGGAAQAVGQTETTHLQVGEATRSS